MTTLKLIRVAEPRLSFRYGQEAEHPRDGLFLFGPLDDKAHPPQLRYGIIGPVMALARFKAWALRAKGPLPCRRQEGSPYGVAGLRSVVPV